MKPIFFFFFLFLIVNQGLSQLTDNFSDGNFDENPLWQGQTDNFIVNNEILQLSDQTPESSNTSYLSVAALTSSDQETTWEFYFRMEFAPSTGNFARIYLSASNSDLSGEQEGYFIKAGGISGNNDAVALFRQDGGSTALLFTGTPGAVATAPAEARLRIIRTTDGEWFVYADYSGGTDFQLEGSVMDNTYQMGAFFGFYCKYTSTRNEHFFFDDVFINPLYQDIQPPQLVEAVAQSSNMITLNFNENIEASAAENPNNYFIDNGIGNPVSASIDAQNPNIVLLEVGTPLTNLITYSLTALNIADPAGNISLSQNVDFTFLNIQVAAINDILITEIMADPFPKPAGLPKAEYIELYNNSEKVIQLESLKLVVNGSQKSLPEYLLLPGQYTTVCDDEFLALFETFGQAVALGTFPALPNGGGQLLIQNEAETVLFEVNYTQSWYGDTEKGKGGWSLEMIDLNDIYDCNGNWKASSDFEGGTPGQENSLLGIPLETNGPVMHSAFAESGFEVLVTFNEAIDEAALTTASFSISDDIGIFSVFVQQPETNTVLLTLSTPLSFGIIYSLTGMSSVADCLGNPLSSGSVVYFGLPETIEKGEIIINEILFDPETSGSDFLELYNRSDKIFDLDDLTLINFQKEDTSFVGRHLLFPGQFVVISENPSDILERYFTEFPDRLLGNDLPGFDNDSGNITLKYGEVTIDSFDYDENMHFGLLTDSEGISLERTSPEIPTQSFGNWHSAAASAGYATPTYKNSQFIIPVEAGSSILSIANTTFSPDNDGFEDILQINYATDQPGFFINLYIFDALGRQIRQIAANELLASEGVYKWDGTTEDGQKARLGIYIVWAELFTTEGNVEQFKETCVLAGRLD